MGALINDRTVYNNASKATANLQEDTEALKHNFLTKGFFKNRGYEDSADLKEEAITKLPSASASKTFSYGQNQIFDKPDIAKLKNEKALAEAGSIWRRIPSGCYCSLWRQQGRFGKIVDSL